MPPSKFVANVVASFAPSVRTVSLPDPAENPFPHGVDTSKLDHSFHIARARAIERYAGLENSVCLLFACLLNTSPELAGVAFFKITSSGYRNKIIETLLEKRLGSQYDLYWHGNQQTKGLFALINQLDGRRNEIVHWHTGLLVNPDGMATSLLLRPPNFWDTRPDRPTLTITELDEFSSKAEFVAGSVMAFFNVVANVKNAFPTNEIAEAWPKIFEQPATFPASDTHPLSPNYKAPQAPPRSFRA